MSPYLKLPSDVKLSPSLSGILNKEREPVQSSDMYEKIKCLGLQVSGKSIPKVNLPPPMTLRFVGYFSIGLFSPMW